MGISILFSNHKGGVGKTTAVLNFGAVLASIGKKVLMINFDGQESLQTYITCGVNGFIPDIMLENKPISSIISDTTVQNLFLVASNKTLENSISSLREVSKKSFHMWLKKQVDLLKKEYDYILIDSPPSLSQAFTLALYASDSLVIPTEVSKEGVKCVESIIDTVEDFKKHFKVTRPVLLGVLPNRVNRLTTITNRKYLPILEENYKVLDILFSSADYAKAQDASQTIIEFNDKSPAIQSIKKSLRKMGVKI